LVVKFEYGRGDIGAVNCGDADCGVGDANFRSTFRSPGDDDRSSILFEVGQSEANGVAPTHSPTFLFPIRALSRMFCGKFVQALQDAEAISMQR
jgi:hypothetical protein